MTISATIVADSVSRGGVRIVTMQLRYPRFIHAEFMTHRAFSRNASSSRAIPVERLIKDVIDDTAMPIHWGKNQPGMQARGQHDDPIWAGGGAKYTPEGAWVQARNNAINVARAFADASYHKQVVNRLLEPFAHINVVVTATNWENFFELRDHPDAQPEICQLARVMREAMTNSAPKRLEWGDWHLPYIRASEMEAGTQTLLEVSAARCARVSYLTHDGRETTLDEDRDLYARLAAGEPRHASPLEHQARPLAASHRLANFIGWQSFRNMMEAANWQL